ncbi:putative caspase-like protein [Bradyrhizobium sp. F1.4.3]|uniref:caspase family protein n=1 Tax=Bradyrhizobium sp. F1.4.3 TaxID=3156356 RepID=UPI003397709E
MRGTHKVFICFVLPMLLLAAGTLDPVRAQQQEKRIALVVGNGAYANSPLATTANDAGLIAQTLQAAGFDVVGARDLDGDTLRKSFRDFIQKAQASGPDTVAMVYLAGYGVQLAGENYFIPVDSNITRDTDVPTEGLRVSDYVRQLASIPLKANIVVLDAGRAQPFIEGGQPIASGLALVEPEANMLIAFNAAPGTVAPEEPGPYSIYAQSLAEMIRTGGLSLPEVFDRVRLRVNEASKGAQVPWDDQKISAQFAFFDRGPDAPPPAAPDQAAATRNKPIRDLGAQDAYAAVLERDTLPAYEEFLGAYPNDPMSKRVMVIVAARREAITWRRTYRTDTPEAYWSYLRRYPRGPHAGDARRRLAILTAPVEPPPSFAMIDYDVPPPPPDEVLYVDRPVLMFSDPGFDFAPPPPPPVYYLPPPPPDFVVLAPPLAVVGLFVLPQPVFVPIPVFVSPPVYVAPPPNNIIYANIHNTTVINTVINQAPAALPAGNAAAAAAVAANGPGRAAGMTAVPTAVKVQAQAIQANPNQQLKPSQAAFVSNPTAKPAAMHVRPVSVAPAVVAPQAPPAAGHALPVPGTQNTPPAPAGAGPLPNGRLAPTATAPTNNALPGHPPGAATATAPAGTAVTAPGQPPKSPTNNTPPGHPLGAATATTPAGTAVMTPGQPPKRPGAQTPTAAGPSDRAKAATHEPATSTPAGGAAAGKPPAAAAKPVAPPPVAREQIRPQNQRSAPPPQVARPSAPPPRPQAVARPTPPPPPRVASPPPRPPVAAARPAPPPAARPAPPPPPRVAAAPPRPAAPPPRPAAPKKCPPNQPKC